MEAMMKTVSDEAFYTIFTILPIFLSYLRFGIYFCRLLMHGEPLMSSLTMQVYMKEKPWFFLIFYLVPYCH